MNDKTGKNSSESRSKHSSKPEKKSVFDKKESSQYSSSAAFTVASCDPVQHPPNGFGSASKSIPFTKLYEKSKRLAHIEENEEEKDTAALDKYSPKKRESAKKKRRDKAAL